MADNSLTAGDIATFPTLIRIQGDIGPGVTSLTQAGVWDFMVQLDVLAREHYSQIQNGPLRAWVDDIFTPLITTPTVYKCSVMALYVAAAWGRWLLPFCRNYPHFARPDEPVDFPATYWAFWHVSKYGWGCPDAPGYWSDALQSLEGGWEPPNAPPQNILWKGPGTTYAQQTVAQEALFSPSQWTDVGVVSPIVGTVAAAQSAAVHALLTGGVLTPGTALGLPYLLLGMGTSVAADQRLAATILSASAPSPEYPNDTFANQLVYLMLMTLADPMGDFGWPNATLQSTLQSLIAAIQQGDPASVALKQSLTNHLKVLVSDASYPMTDPYNPATGFTTRQTDTLAALNRAWATLRTA
jgi:hypothetical protein